MPKPLPMPSPFQGRAVPRQPTSEEVARARLLQSSSRWLEISVVVGEQEAWKEPDPKENILEAYVAAQEVEAYLIIVEAKKAVKPTERSTWEGLQGVIMNEFYSPQHPSHLGGFLSEKPEEKSSYQLLKETRSVTMPSSLLAAAGIDRQGVHNYAPLRTDKVISPEDLAFVRRNVCT